MSEINAKFYNTNGLGQLSLIKAHSGWRKTWHIIVPGDFGGSAHLDLFLYDRINGEAKFITTDGEGNIELLKHHTGLRKTWDVIVPGHFGNSGRTGLLFYDRVSNDAMIFTTNGQGSMTLLKHHTGWTANDWDIIVPGHFGGSGNVDLFFYDRTKGEANFSTTDNQGNITPLKKYTGWRKTWDIIVGGQFAGTLHTDLLFYQKVTGEAKLFTTDGQGNMTLLKHHTGLRKTWDIIVPGNFNTKGWADLLFYDRAAGAANFSTIDAKGNLETIKEHNDWPKSWFTIIAGGFGKSFNGSLFMYDNKYRLRIHAIKCADSDGAREAKITPQEVQKWLARANEVYATAGVLLEFDPASDWEFLKNTTINNLCKFADDDPKKEEKEKFKLAASAYAKGYPGKIVVFFRHGFKTGPAGDGFSSTMATYVAMPGFTATSTTAYYLDGTSKKIQNIKIFAHELGHYLGLGHTFRSINYDEVSDPADAVIAYLKSKNAKTSEILDGDLSRVKDTPPDVGKGFFLKKGENPADMSIEIKIKSEADGIDFAFSPDRQNVMSYFNCNDYYRITTDQARRIREWLHTDYRKHLIEGQD